MFGFDVVSGDDVHHHVRRFLDVGKVFPLAVVQVVGNPFVDFQYDPGNRLLVGRR